MQDICGWSGSRPIPCAVKKPPHRFEDDKEVLALLRDECPELFIDKPADYVPDVCCSPVDVLAIQNFKNILAKIFDSPCKACVTNSIEIFCHLTCAPNQDEFLEVVKSTPVGNGSIVEELNYYITKPSVEGLFDECKKLPQMKTLLESVGCKNTPCNLDDYLYAFTSRKTNSPYDLNLIWTNKDDTKTINGGKKIVPADLLIEECA